MVNPMARLILVTAEGGQQSLELRATNSLGRHPNNSIQLLDKIVSKEHCLIEQRGEHFVLRDLGSLNGTYINGERVVGEGPLKHGDEIALGATRARFDDGSGRPMAAAYLPPSPDGSRRPAARHRRSPMPSAREPSPPYRRARAQRRVRRSDDGGQGGRRFRQYPGYSAPRPGPSPLAQSAVEAPGAPRRRATALKGSAPIAAGSQNFHGTRIEMHDEDRAIGTQIDATHEGVPPLRPDRARPRAAPRRLRAPRASHELSREIAPRARHSTSSSIRFCASIFKFIHADRGVIFLQGERRRARPRVEPSPRRDRRAHSGLVDNPEPRHQRARRACSPTTRRWISPRRRARAMILNRISSSAIVVPLLHNEGVLGVLWLDSRDPRAVPAKDLELVTAIGNQAAMFIENQHAR